MQILTGGIMTQTDKFNPNEHLTTLKNGKSTSDYLEVKWRLVWFRENCPSGTIDTEEMLIDLDREVEVEVYVWSNEKRRSEKVTRKSRGYARFRAVVTDGKGGRATGTKSENAANFADYIEKAETGAIGRALAMLGYGTQFAPEIDEGPRIVDSPVERSNIPTPSQDEMQHALPAPDIAALKAKWVAAYTIADEQIEVRWKKYLQYLLKLDEAALKKFHVATITRDLATQTEKLSVVASA
jgi:hypothetical protein